MKQILVVVCLAISMMANAKTKTEKAMYYNISWLVEFDTNGDKSQLGVVEEIDIVASVNNLTDIATLTLPATVMNKPINFKGKIKRGTEISIKLGYDEDLKPEFIGFIRDIKVNDSNLQIVCEDALFLFRKGVANKEYKETNVSGIAQDIIKQIDPSYSLNCDYNITYEKFTVYDATGFDVLKKLQTETKANIYFDNENKVLHIHKPYVEIGNKVYYSLQKNVENSSLEYQSNIDKKTEVIVESTNTKGKTLKISEGVTGGDKITFKVGPMTEQSMREIAKASLRTENAARYKGTFDTWLYPRIQPTDSHRIKDEDYPNQTAFYYTIAVNTNISANGAVRTITPGIKLS